MPHENSSVVPDPSGSRGEPRLFTPARIGPVVLRNRVVMPPMTTRVADGEGFVTDDAIAYYCARAEGGVGLIIVEMASPEKAGRHRRFELGIYDDTFLPGLRRLVDALHRRGAKVAIQLGHGGGHTRIDICGETPVAPSAIPHVVQEGHTETIVPEAMSLERIERAVRAFAAAAVRAEQAGFDIVEIHAAHGYLISQFLTPAENLRDDDYGGSLANRARFGLDIVRRVKQAAPGLGVIFRINGDDFFPGGMPFDEARQVAIWAAEAGADAIHVTGGHYRSQPTAAVMIPPMAMPEATFLAFAAAIRQQVQVPVIAVGRLGEPAIAIGAIEAGKADFVALGRPLLADPEWVDKVRAGRPVRPCLACNTCVDGMREGRKVSCLVNAATGRERTFGAIESRRRPRQAGKRIAVIGAGPAGLTYASLVAADNQVTVFERAGRAGGAFLLAGLAPKFQNVDANPASLTRYVDGMVELCRQAGVTFVFDCDVSADPRRLAAFDLIVLATGASYRWGLGGAMCWALRQGAFRLPGLRRLGAMPSLRDWFYYRARRPAAARLRRGLGEGRPVIVIGDAQAPGKGQEAIVSAFEAALGAPADESVASAGGTR